MYCVDKIDTFKTYIFEIGGEAMYVGVTENFLQRMNHHKNNLLKDHNIILQEWSNSELAKYNMVLKLSWVLCEEPFQRIFNPPWNKYYGGSGIISYGIQIWNGGYRHVTQKAYNDAHTKAMLVSIPQPTKIVPLDCHVASLGILSTHKQYMFERDYREKCNKIGRCVCVLPCQLVSKLVSIKRTFAEVKNPQIKYRMSSGPITNAGLFDGIKQAPIEETTKESYMKQLKMLQKYNPDLGTLLMNPDKYGPLISEGERESTKAALFKVIIALLKHSGLKETNQELYYKWYKDYFNESNAVIKQKWAEYKQAPKTLEGAMTWQEIIDKYNAVSREKSYSLDHVSLGMYTIIPPRRQRDYWKLLLIHNQNEKVILETDKSISGYLDLTVSPALLVVMTYKTKKNYDEWRKVLPPPLDKIIRRHLQTRPGAKYLFEKLNGDPFPTHHSFTVKNNNVLKRVLDNKDASVNVLRHAASTWVYYNNKMTPLQKEQYARDMGHSVNTQSHYVM